MPDQPKKSQPLDFEELKRQLGPEKMAFLSEMLRPDAEDEREEETNLPTAPNEVTLTPEHERAVIEYLESQKGRKLTPEERHLALEQERLL